MAYKTRSTFIRGRSSGRLTEWFGSTVVAAETPLGILSFTFDQTLAAGGLAKRPFTITRTIGSIWVGSDQAAAPEYPFGAMGMRVVSDKAAATGVTALPDPISEISDDEWFVWRGFAGYGGTLQGRGNLTEFKFDSRGQRKVQDGETIVVMVANASAADALNYIILFRMLVKLS